MQKDLPIYCITISDEYSDGKTEMGWRKTAYTASPAILTKGMAFNEVKKLSFTDGVKMRIVAPVMVPDLPIYRKDEDGEYYVQFKQDDVDQIYADYMQHYSVSNQNFNLEHKDGVEPSKSFMLETWQVGKDPLKDKAYSEFGIDVPSGSIVQIMQITDRAFYDELVEKEMYGFSLEGFLGLKLNQIINNNKINKKETMNKQEFKLADGSILTLNEDGTHTIQLAEEYPAEDKKCDCPEGEDCKCDGAVNDDTLPAEMAEDEVVVEDKPVDEAPAEDKPMEEYPTYTKAEIDAKLDEILKMIGELKAEDQTEDDAKMPEGEVVELSKVERMAMNVQGILKLRK